MMIHPAPFACDPQLWQRFLHACQMRDAAPNAVLRDLVRREVQRHGRRAATADDRPDPAQLAQLRHLVAQALSNARTWEGAQAALHLRGLAYARCASRLMLIDCDTGEVLCAATQAGPGLAGLARRFGAGFPGLHRPGLAALAAAAVQPPRPRAAKGRSLPMPGLTPCDRPTPDLG